MSQTDDIAASGLERDHDIDIDVVRRMANSDRPSAWIYRRYLEFYEVDDT